MSRISHDRFLIGGASIVCPLPDSGLGYIGQAADAEARMAEGQTQMQCTACLLWRWADQQANCDRLRSLDSKPRGGQ